MIFPVKKPVFVGSKIPGFDLLIFVFKSSNQRLEKEAQRIAKRIKVRAGEVNIISNEPITLRDGTFAYESVIEFKTAGIYKVKSIHLSAFKDDHRIRISIYTNPNYYNENLRDMLYSLKFY